MNELIIQLFDAQPRRPAAVFNLLVGKKTLSTLYAALEHDQLQWLNLMPQLERADFDRGVAALTAAGALRAEADGLVRTQPAPVTLPPHYHPWMGISEFAGRFYLAVQSLSEASFGNRRYRPVTPDWATQTWVRNWWSANHTAAVPQLTALFARLDSAAADRLAASLVGHDYVGPAQTLTWADAMATIEAFAQVLAQLDQAPSEFGCWATLWGGRVSLLSDTNVQALELAAQGQTRQQIQSALRRKISTVNEHLLVGSIFGATFPLAAFYPPKVLAAFNALPLPAPSDYQALLAAVPGSDFFQVRLYQILQRQGRWPA